MIKYKYPEEQKILLHYAQQFNDQETLTILEKGYLENASEAQHLASFFWKMVDQTVEDVDQGKTVAGHTDLEAWCEYIMQTLRSYFIASGFLSTWEIESDKT